MKVLDFRKNKPYVPDKMLTEIYSVKRSLPRKYAPSYEEYSMKNGDITGMWSFGKSTGAFEFINSDDGFVEGEAVCSTGERIGFGWKRKFKKEFKELIGQIGEENCRITEVHDHFEEDDEYVDEDVPEEDNTQHVHFVCRHFRKDQFKYVMYHATRFIKEIEL